MEFLNETDYGAGVVRAVVSEHDIQAAVVCKPTFRVERGQLVADLGEVWPVGPDPVETDYGSLDGELPFYRRGIDVIVAGTAHAPGGRPVPALDVELSVGSVLASTIRVFGDRLWVEGEPAPVISAPEPFMSMPLTYERSFGGEAEHEVGPVTFGSNPVGRGFYLSPEGAIGRPLPNLEDPSRPIRSWDDRPDPVGFGPYSREWGLRLANAVEVREGENGPKIEAILPTFNNNAHPRLIIEDPRRLRVGDVVRITNMRDDTPDGSLTFPLPALRLHVHVQLEDRHRLYPLYLEQIFVMSDEARVMLSYRVCFRYTIVPMERRFVTLHGGPVPTEVPAEYVIDPDAREPVP